MTHVSRKLFLPILILGIAALALTFPLGWNGYLSGHDYPLHLRWYTFFHEQQLHGDLYPRWLMSMNAGQGSPVFYFYAPVPYFITSLLHPLFATGVYATHQLAAAAALAVFISGLTMFLWLRSGIGTVPAVGAALSYLLLPYLVLIDVYRRFAFGETWALAWMPLVLWFTQWLIEGKRYAMPSLALVYALLLMTHLPSTLLFSLVPILYLGVSLSGRARLVGLVKLVGAYLLGIGLAAIYLLPAMTTQDYVSVKEIAAGTDAVFNNFLFYGPRFVSGNIGDFYRQLTLGTMITGVVALLATVIAFRVAALRMLQVGFWFALAVLGLFMTHPFSALIWRTIEPIQIVQFPWRFDGLLSLAAAVLCGYALAALQKHPTLWRRVLWAGILILLVMPWIPQAKPMLWNSVKVFKPYPSYFINNFDAYEYRPRWVPAAGYAALKSVDLSATPVVRVSVVSGRGAVDVTRWSPGDIRIKTNNQTAVSLKIRQFFYPSWQAHEAASRTQWELHPAASDGLIVLDLPAGSQNIELTLAPLPAESWGRGISLIALLAIVGMLLREARRSKST
jgi:hypothetical protein